MLYSSHLQLVAYQPVVIIHQVHFIVIQDHSYVGSWELRAIVLMKIHVIVHSRVGDLCYILSRVGVTVDDVLRHVVLDILLWQISYHKNRILATV